MLKLLVLFKDMEEQIITKQAVRQVISDYWQQYKAHPLYLFIGSLLPALGNILRFFIPPLIVGELIDTFVERGAISLNVAAGYIALFAGLWLLGEVFWRTGIHFLIKLEARAINTLNKIAFRRLVKRDYDFYANNFVGSLTKKSLAFSRGFEIFTDTMTFNVVSNVFPIIFAVVILWRYSPIIPLVLILWILIAVVVGLPIVRRRSRLVVLRHDASSKMAGRLSDSITNILAIKSFAKEKLESKMYGKYVDDFTKKAKRTWDYQNLRFDVAMSPIYVITNVFGLVAAIFFVQNLGLQAGVIVVVFSYYARITLIFWQINRVYRHVESAISEAAEFTQLIIEPPSSPRCTKCTSHKSDQR